MGEIRGEKVTFGKQDIVALHELPSAQHEDALIVRSPRSSRSYFRHCLHILSVLISIILFAVVGLFLAIEGGVFDRILNNEAQVALSGVVGDRFETQIGSTVIRFGQGPQLALEARNVTMVEKDSGKEMSRTGSIRLALDPIALLSGMIAVSKVEAQGISLDPAFLSTGPAIDFSQMRVDQIPGGVEMVFAKLDMIRDFVTRTRTDSAHLSDLKLQFAQVGGPPLDVTVNDMDLLRTTDGILSLDGSVTVNGSVSHLSVHSPSKDGRSQSLTAALDGVNLTPFALKHDAQGVPRQGIDTTAGLTLSATRVGDGEEPAVSAELRLGPGNFYSDGNAQELTSGVIAADYDFGKQSLELRSSLLAFGGTTVPFTGGIIDLDRLDPKAGTGFGLDLLIRDGVSAPASGEQPLPYQAQLSGRYLTQERELSFDQAAVSTPIGGMHGALKFRFTDAGSPEISFGSQAQELQTAAIKQLWPFWISPKTRQWVYKNLFGGTVTNATISVFIPAGRIPPGGGPLHLDENELRISFDIDQTRMNIAGEIPPLRDTSAHLDMTGKRVQVDVKSGSSYFPSGRSVKVENARFVLPSAYDKPLMANIDIDASGAADAIAELATYRPIKVLARTGFAPEDFKGTVSASVQATFGLIIDQDPPPPVWDVVMKLDGVDILKPLSGRHVTNLDGTLTIDTLNAVLDGKGRLDDVAADLHISEPVDKAESTPRERVVSMTLDNSNREKFAPGLGSIVDGPTKVQLTRVADNRQSVTLELDRAAVSVPWLGWTKGSGVPAKALFELNQDGTDVTIKNFSMSGEGFGVQGDMLFSKNGLVSANLSKVQLGGNDNFAVDLSKGKSGYDISITGDVADVRPVIRRLRQTDTGGSSGDKSASLGGSVKVKAKLDRITGFNNEGLDNVDLLYSTSNDKIQALKFTAVTKSGQAVVGEMSDSDSGNALHLTSGDAGAVARFADLYKRMNGGLLNANLKTGQGQAWNGNIDIRSFSLANESALQSIVTTPVGKDGRSLNNAVKRDIDVSSENFSRGFARLIARDGVLQVENGILRGEQIGATFQGTLRDALGKMDMTGTFMPAYGLNRLFAELPLIGVILGNGRDRGLLGITFRLKGAFDAPQLSINPLSIIAPGIFRQIFEFQ